MSDDIKVCVRLTVVCGPITSLKAQQMAREGQNPFERATVSFCDIREVLQKSLDDLMTIKEGLTGDGTLDTILEPNK